MKQPCRYGGLLQHSAILLYFAAATVLGVENPGFQYDEALLVRGAVHMLHSPEEPAFNHEAGSWVRTAGRFLPLMALPYEGAIKDYLVLLPFSLFGPDYRLVRGLGLLLGATGIWGVGILLRNQLGAVPAATSSLILAVHPTYLNMTLYDKDVATWMAAMGLAAAALSRYLDHPEPRRALWLGLAVGVGVWGRANFVWLVAAAILAALVVLGRRVLVPARHLAAGAAGVLVGSAPLILYEFLSHGETFRFMRSGQVPETLLFLLPGRLAAMADALLVDPEHRAIWAAPELPALLRWFIPAIFVSALFLCLFSRRGEVRDRTWRRAFALTFLVLVLFLLTSPLNIAAHHMAALVPLAVPVVVMGLRLIPLKKISIAILAAYFGCSCYLDLAGAAGMRATGGVGPWSSEILAVRDYLIENYPGREVKILDWGLQNNLYVLSDARIRSRELFWGATAQQTGEGRNWEEEIQPGSLYLLNGAGNVQFPAATNALIKRLETGISHRKIEFLQKNGKPFTIIIEVAH